VKVVYDSEIPEAREWVRKVEGVVEEVWEKIGERRKQVVR
jgi:hypothetical protein